MKVSDFSLRFEELCLYFYRLKISFNKLEICLLKSLEKKAQAEFSGHPYIRFRIFQC